ncbi:transcriptional regulator [Wenjunlia vitaminophila]|uniref:Transcriptional regulator n=1 Tax=Wenjunlia vitaminophila TaxID=76728 RepID=A0A0T6LWX4_WENVI|nr:MarR family transcriptional regulator [Wenjunlia vitaminophila]KRV50338.1 transcriptional regulator [Wenjunlia vitaminophila]
MPRSRRSPPHPNPNEANRRETLDWIFQSTPDLNVNDAELGALLFAGSGQLVRTVEDHLHRYGLSPGRFAVLLALGSAPGGQRTPSALAERIAVSRPTVTGIVDGLVNAGLARRCADPTNRRNQPVALTEEGQRLIEETVPDHFRRLAAAVGRFSPAERETLRQAMGLINRFGDFLLEEKAP